MGLRDPKPLRTTPVEATGDGMVRVPAHEGGDQKMSPYEAEQLAGRLMSAAAQAQKNWCAAGGNGALHKTGPKCDCYAGGLTACCAPGCEGDKFAKGEG